MVKKNLMTFNPDAVAEIRRVATVSNDVIENAISNNEYVFVIKHDKDNPLTFTVISDPYLEDLDDDDDDEDEEGENNDTQYSLVGTKLTFADPQDFIKLFPDLAQLPQVQLGPNQRRDQNTGKPVGILPDEIEIKSITPYDTNDKTPNPRIIIELIQPTTEAGSLWIMWQHDKLDPKPYVITIATNNEKGEENKNYNIIPEHKNRQTNPTLQDGMFEIYGLPENTTISKILVQVNNALSNTSPPISSMLQILKTTRITRSKPVNQ